MDVGSDGSSASGVLLLGLSSMSGNVWDGEIRLLRRGEDEEDHHLQGGWSGPGFHVDSGISTIKWLNRDANCFITGDDAGDLRLYKAPQAGGDLSLIMQLKDHDEYVTSLAVNGSNEVFSISADGVVKMWDVTEGRLEASARLMERDRGAPPAAVASCFLDETTCVISYLQQGFLGKGHLVLWDTRQKSSFAVSPAALELRPTCLAASGDGFLFAGCANGQVVGMDTRLFSFFVPLSSSSRGSPSPPVFSLRMHRHASPVRALAVEKGGRAESRFVSGADDGTVLNFREMHADLVSCAAFGVEPGVALTGSLDGTLASWDL